VPGFHLLVFSILLGIASPLLFALPIPPQISYWAYGFPAMVMTLGIEFLTPILALRVVQLLPEEHQSLGGGLIQTANNLGKSIGLAIATLVQTIVVGDAEVGVPGDQTLLKGIRAGQWASVGMVTVSLLITLVYFRRLGRC
jgi:hypothetical protein